MQSMDAPHLSRVVRVHDLGPHFQAERTVQLIHQFRAVVIHGLIASSKNGSRYAIGDRLSDVTILLAQASRLCEGKQVQPMSTGAFCR